VSARQIFSGACGISFSMIKVLVSFELLIGPSS
jgi:hypothetical protein